MQASRAGQGTLAGLRLLAAMMVGCAEPPDDPGRRVADIVGGAPSLGDEAVAAVGPRRDACEDTLAVTCTGTLIAPRVVLTAAHCLPRPGVTIEVLFGPDVTGPGEAVQVVEATAHPAYDDATNANDIALLLLDGEPAIAPAPLAPRALTAADVGATARIVGFGASEAGGQPTGVRMEGTAGVSSVGAGTFEIAPAPALTCQGDSGGPVFLTIDGAEVVAGVVVAGDVACATYGSNADVGSHRDAFIVPYVDQTESAPPPHGPGPVELAAICQEPCGVDDDCPAGFTCAPPGPDGARRCRIAGAIVARYTGACAVDGDCASGDCARLPSGQGCGCRDACDEVVEPPGDPDGCGCGESTSHTTGSGWLLLLLFGPLLFKKWTASKN
jgi:hypothetical protein